MELIERYCFKNYKIQLSLLPVYGSKIVFCSYTDLDGYYGCLDYLSDLGLEDKDLRSEDWYKCFGWMVKIDSKTTYQVICLNLSSPFYKSFLKNTISHEVYHMVQSIAKHHGLSFTKNNDNEHIAYLIGYLNNCVYNFINVIE